MSPKVETKTSNPARLLNKIDASVATTVDGKQTPLQIVPSGTWTDSWKGTIEILPEDLVQMAANFNAGVGLAGGGVAGAPIDYAHAEWDKAAGWITAVDIIDGVLCATSYEWTTEAAAAIESGEWKFFSPSFVPACLGSWCDPEDPTITARNVLLGGGLTNKPFFKGLTGLISASETREGNDGINKIYISASAQGETMHAEVSAILAKDPSTITADERKVLADNRTQLTTDQLVSFKVDAAAEPAPATDPKPAPAVIDASQYPQDVKDALALQASVSAGTHKIVAKSDFDALKASVTLLEERDKKAKESAADTEIDNAVRAGQIKTEDRDSWKALVLASESNLTLLQNLPKNEKLGHEAGADGGETQVDASAQLDAKVKALMASEKLSYGDAAKKVMTDDPELAKAYVDSRTQQ